VTLFDEREELYGSSAAVAAWPRSFDLGPTARQAGAWTQLRRRLHGLQGSAEPLFPGGSFDSELAVQQAGSWTQLRRNLDAASLPPPLRLGAPQLGALLGAFVLSCALVRPWTSLQGKAHSSEVRAPDRASGALSTPAVAANRAPGRRAAHREAPVRAPGQAPALGSFEAKLVDGEAVLPAAAPEELEDVVTAANRITGMPYAYGGGHGSFSASGYDCSGAVSYALHGGGLLDSPLDSGGFTAWGLPGEGKAITVYANSGHAYAMIAGLRWDTSDTGGSGPSWHQEMRSTAGFVARHPSGY